MTASGSGTLRNIEKIHDKVQKLLNQAADREGTAEGDSFFEKAFRLMAVYGFDERDLASPDEGDEVVHKVFEFKGSYTDMQSALLLAIATGLHCTGFASRVRNSTKMRSSTIFGAKRHLERVEMLFALLLPVMVNGARGVSAQPWEETSTVVRRRSYMTGFAHQIGARIAEAEHSVADPRGTYALALVGDKEKAEAAQEAFAANEGITFTHFASNRSFDTVAYGCGIEAGKSTDLGQTRVKARPALPF